MTKTTGDFASGSYGTHPTFYYGRIESIDDGNEKDGGSTGSSRSRCKVRIFGYEDGKDTIPNEKLEWCHCVLHNSQMHGDSATQPYYPGAQVMLLEIGTERYILGAIPGYDSSKKLKDNPDGADTSQDQYADVPNNQIRKGQYKKPTLSTIRASQGLIPKGTKRGLSYDGQTPGYFDYSKWDEHIRKIFPYALGKGEKPAPWGKGTQAKFSDMQTIGYDKTQKGSDILDVIKQKDGNQSGAIKQSIDIIKSLRNNGYGTSNQVIGQSLQQGADQEFINAYGNQTKRDKKGKLSLMKDAKNQIASMTPETFRNAALDGSLMSSTSLFQDADLNVDSGTINNMYGIIAQVQNLDMSSPGATAFLQEQLISYQNEFKQAIRQGVNTTIAQMQTDKASLSDDEFVDLYGGPAELSEVATLLQDLNLFANGSDLPDIGGGILQKALSGSLSPSKSQPNKQQQNMNREATRFQGNKNALGEIGGGGKNPESLLGMVLKYEGAKDPDHPNNNFKTFLSEGKGR